MQVVFQNFIKKSNSLGYLKSKKDAKARKYSNEAALSLRSRRSGTKFAAPLFAELLIKYQRLPRGFLWNTSLPPLVDWLFCFLKNESQDNYGIERWNVAKGDIFYSVFLFSPRIFFRQALMGYQLQPSQISASISGVISS